jgi:regulatory protein SWI5
MSSASSTTGYSDSNSGNSPGSDIDILDDKPFADYEYIQSSSTMPSSSFEYSQAQSPAGDCVSPQAMQNTPSPVAFSSHSQFSHRGSVSETLPSPPHSPAKSVHSIHSYHSPPGLCESSSSPAPSNQYYDLDNSSNHGDGMANIAGLDNISEHDDDMFLQAFAASSANDMTQLERDPDLLMGKLEDAFGSAANEDLFKDDADLFSFGSP